MWASSLLVLLLSQTPPGKQVCVPAEGGTGWTCGTDAAALSSGAVPARRERSMPPLLLIDPRRFDEGFNEVSAPETALPAAVKQPSAAATLAPAVTRLARASAASASQASTRAGGRFSLQLAATNSPDNFPALLRKFRLDPTKARTVRSSEQVWLLLYGDFPDAATARAAIPKNATGAWARDLATLAR